MLELYLKCPILIGKAKGTKKKTSQQTLPHHLNNTNTPLLILIKSVLSYVQCNYKVEIILFSILRQRLGLDPQLIGMNTASVRARTAPTEEDEALSPDSEDKKSCTRSYQVRIQFYDPTRVICSLLLIPDFPG